MMDRTRPEIPAALQALMTEVGPRWGEGVTSNVKMMVDEFSKVHAAASHEDSRVTADIAYGAHPRQQFDLFEPATGSGKRPLVIFVHGGAFVQGHRNRTPQIYANVLHYFARHGILGINMGYRLAPDATYPEASLDIAAVVSWAHDHAAEIGADPKRIFLMGHSAGGAHAGAYAYDRRIHGKAGPRLAGLVIVSGRVRAETLPDNPNAEKVRAYYGSDPSRLENGSAVSHVDANSVPTFIAMAQYENPLIDLHCLELANRLAVAKRRVPPVFWLRGHNHTSIIGHMNTAEDVLGGAIRTFIAKPY
jgi:acetyl esterase/lipase